MFQHLSLQKNSFLATSFPIFCPVPSKAQLASMANTLSLPLPLSLSFFLLGTVICNSITKRAFCITSFQYSVLVKWLFLTIIAIMYDYNICPLYVLIVHLHHFYSLCVSLSFLTLSSHFPYLFLHFDHYKFNGFLAETLGLHFRFRVKVQNRWSFEFRTLICS